MVYKGVMLYKIVFNYVYHVNQVISKTKSCRISVFKKTTEFGFGLKALQVKFGVVNVHYHNFYTPYNVMHANKKDLSLK